jgi:RNA polymerase sigma-70 factor (ECF subfamily)
MTAVLLSFPAFDGLRRFFDVSAGPVFFLQSRTRRAMNLTSDAPATVGPEVVQRIATGDAKAFASFYDAFSGALYSLAFKILGSAEEAEDVLQTACLRMWDDAVRFDARRGTPFTWAYTITRSKALDRLRLRQRRAQLMESGGMQEIAAQGSTVPSAEEELAIRERAAAVRSALGTLPEDQREAIELAFFNGLTQQEIAARLGEPLGTVKARIRRGMMKLKCPLAKFV